MKVKPKIAFGIIFALGTFGLFAVLLKGKDAPSPDHYRTLFTCDGGSLEQKFLASHEGSIVSNGLRRCIPPDGFVTYTFVVGESELERAYWGINQVGFQLEFSTDGNDWSSLVNLAAPSPKKPKRFSNQSCGFSAERKKTAARSGSAYFRFSTKETDPNFYLTIKYFGLQVSGPTIPEHFHRPSISRNIAANLTRMLAPKLMILVGLGAAIICHRLWKTRWRLFGAGALLWIGSVAAKFTFAYFGLKPVDKAVHDVLPPFIANLAYWSYIGLLTGVFECGIFLLFSKYIRRGQWNWKDATSLGVGFGAIEAIVTGIATAATAGIEFSGVFSLGGDVDFASSFVGPLERLIALTVHATSVAMIIYALTQRRWIWFVLSFLYKSGIDGVAAFIALSASKWSNAHPWIVGLLLFGPFAYIGFWILFALRKLWSQGNQKNMRAPIT